MAAYANGIADMPVGRRAAEAALVPLATDLAARDAAQYRALAIAVAQRLVQWPPLEGPDARAARQRSSRLLAEARRQRARLPAPTCHPLSPHGEGWRCLGCYKYARSPSAPAFARVEAASPPAKASRVAAKRLTPVRAAATSSMTCL